jgi:hypothetical protein
MKIPRDLKVDFRARDNQSADQVREMLGPPVFKSKRAHPSIRLQLLLRFPPVNLSGLWLR